MLCWDLTTSSSYVSFPIISKTLSTFVFRYNYERHLDLPIDQTCTCLFTSSLFCQEYSGPVYSSIRSFLLILFCNTYAISSWLTTHTDESLKSRVIRMRLSSKSNPAKPCSCNLCTSIDVFCEITWLVRCVNYLGLIMTYLKKSPL